MFDIGFFELMLIAIVGLLVIGPERLPETLRTLALWWGRLKRAVHNTRSEFEQHIGADDIRRQLHNEEIMRQLNDTRQSLKGIESDVNREINKAEKALDDSPANKPEAPKAELPADTEQSVSK